MSQPKARNIHFDYDRLHEIMRNAGGVKSVCKRVGIPDATFYHLKKNVPNPLPAKLRALIRELDLPLSVLRSLFIEDKDP